MAFLFQRKLVCFYCGCKSAQTRTPDVRRWQCTHCEAENYLDENGDITDPPAEDVSSNAPYTESLARLPLPPFVAPDDPLFCPTCLKNQHLVSQALASYLPPPDAPDYAEYEKAEAEYLKGLEERYPQVCQRCEPKVQERIKAAGYAAKTDHLRRMMDRTRGHGIQYRDANWRSPLITLGGVGWFISLAGQILWDGLSFFECTEGRHGLRDVQNNTTISVCLQRVMRGSSSVSDCTKLLHSAAGLALLLGILTSWWNPKLQETLRRRDVRAIGTAEFYQLQGILLILRCATWWYLPSYELDAHKTRAAHLFLLGFTVVMNITSFRSVRIDYSARIKFQDSPAPLLSQTTQQKAPSLGSGNISNVPQRPNQSNTRNDGGIRPFSITDLAPLSSRHPPVYQPPTPSPDEDNSEAMDWTPSQESKILRQPTSYRTFNALSQQPQQISCREKFPREPLNESTGLRNLSDQPMFRKRAETNNREYFKTPKKYRDSSDESPFATPFEPSLVSGSPDLSPVKFAQPRFFPHTDREDLGLESLMANNFSLAEEPHEVRARQRQGNSKEGTHSKLGGTSVQWHGPAALLLLAISCSVWICSQLPSLAALRMHFRLVALCFAGLVILKSLLLFARKGSGRSFGDIVLLAFELITTIILGATLHHREAISPSENNVGSLETPGVILIAALIAQEAWMLYSSTWGLRKSNADVASPPVPQPAAAANKAHGQQPIAGSTLSSIGHDLTTGLARGSNGQRFPALSQRTTRSRTRLENNTRARGDLSGLSLDGKVRNDQALGVSSLNLGQPQRRNQNGMW